MVIKYCNKPFFLAALICLFIFYSGIFKIPDKNNFQSLLKENQITRIEGLLVSSPGKISSGKYYSSKFQVFSAKDSRNQTSSCKGTVTVFIPSKMVEAYFPGKLYSSARKTGAYIYEAGGLFTFEGKFSSSCFYIDKCSEGFYPATFFGKIDFFRALCRLQFKRLMYSWGSAGGLLLALLSGAREYTDQTAADNFKNAGLSHILALSGMHLSMFSSIAVFFGKRLGRKKSTYILRISVLILFVWFAGFSPSLLRAFICAVLCLMATMNGTNNPDMILILCFSFLLQCVISPGDIHNAGFMLSYGALWGILITGKIFNRIYSKLFPFYISSSLSASTGAQVFTAPISLKLFGSFAPIGIIATTVISPLVTLFIYSGLFLIIVSLIFPVLQRPSGIFVNLQYTVINFLVAFFAHAPKWSLT